MALRGHSPPDLSLLLEGALRRSRRSPGTRSLGRRPGFRCPYRLASLRLDGRSQSRPGEHITLSGSRSRRARYQGQPGLGRPCQDPGRERHQRLRGDRRRVDPSGAPRLEHHRPRTRRTGRGEPALGLVAGYHGRTHPRRRRLPRDGSTDKVACQPVSMSAGPEAVAVAQMRGLPGRTDRDRHPVFVTKGDLARFAVKPSRSGIVGSASVGPALSGRLAYDPRSAVFLAATRVLRLAGRTSSRLAHLLDPVIVLDPIVIPRAGISIARLLRLFGHHDSRLYRPLVRLFNVFGNGGLGNGALAPPGLGNRRFRLVLVLRAGRERDLSGGGDARNRKQNTGEGCEYDGAAHAGSCLRVTARRRYRFVR